MFYEMLAGGLVLLRHQRPQTAALWSIFAPALTVSAVYDKHFLVDGTATHGVSGGPAFCSTTGGLRIVGSISAYLPNLVEKGAFHGLSVITHAFAHGDIKVTGG